MKKVIIIVITLLAVVAIGIFAGPSAWTAWQKMGAESASKSFIEKLTAGKNAEAYKMTSSSLKKVQTEAEFTASMGDLKSTKPIYKTATTFIKDGKAYYYQTVDGLPATKSGRTDGNFALVLVNEGGWKVQTASVK